MKLEYLFYFIWFPFIMFRCDVWCCNVVSSRRPMGTPGNITWAYSERAVSDAAARCQCCRIFQLCWQCCIQVSDGLYISKFLKIAFVQLLNIIFMFTFLCL